MNGNNYRKTGWQAGRTRRRVLVSGALWALGVPLLVGLTPAPQAYAAPGDLDTTFSGDGRRLTDFDDAQDEARAVAVQPNGKIVAAGFAAINGQRNFALARYNPNGSLDDTFAGNGKATISSSYEANAVLIQPDGKIIAVGGAGALARLNTDGTLDTTFGGDGTVTTAWPNSNAYFRAAALQPDGKIIAAGDVIHAFDDYDFALARYNPDGSLDASFSSNGKVVIAFGQYASAVSAVAVQPDGKIVAAGFRSLNGSSDFALVRLNPDGSLDTSFAGDGKVITDISGGTDQADALVLQPDGKIVTGGYYSTSISNSYFALTRYTPQGALDSTFAFGGKMITDFGTGSETHLDALVLQPDGKIVAGGWAYGDDTRSDFALARYGPNGLPDTTFSGDARVTTDFPTGNYDKVYALVLQPDGKIVAAGSSTGTYPDSDFALARYEIAP